MEPSVIDRPDGGPPPPTPTRDGRWLRRLCSTLKKINDSTATTTRRKEEDAASGGGGGASRSACGVTPPGRCSLRHFFLLSAAVGPSFLDAATAAETERRPITEPNTNPGPRGH
uniref:Uncharacterized protein n=1 Tax=Steinernema glaseri TaxID=37863 RepID=A0A1I7YJ67_9BILA